MPPEKPYPLDEILHPKSVAVVGASASQQAGGWVSRLINFGYTGEVYPVNPRADEINGLKAYPTVRDIPYPVDYVIFNIPARLAPQIMEDCVAKGVKAVHMFTAGFSETGRGEAAELERQTAETARKGGVRIIGPNCMGVYCPESGLTFNPAFSREPGKVAFIAQTGAGTIRFVYLANDMGIHFSKVISYGNAIDLDAPDFLEYLAGDDETGIIGCYIEGVRDGRRFLEVVKKCLSAKPVVILKAGLTEGGAGAAASHTAALAGSGLVWDAFFKQTRAVPVNTIEEMADMLLTFSHMPCPGGRRVAIVGRGGGIGVIATDTCERAGLRVPPFLNETRRQLEEIIPEAGTGARNPVETALGMAGAADFYNRGLAIVDADPQIDLILIQLAVDVYGGRQPYLKEQLVSTAEVLINTAQALAKPVAVVFGIGEDINSITAVLEARQKLLAAGIPVYSSIEVAARCLNKLIEYNQWPETD
ncbi:MAG: CoA-binding protein [Dehalococcoidales bacterium]|nr:MAG: CoA-binding protein [Dehalococcoidales bacterium]